MLLLPWRKPRPLIDAYPTTTPPFLPAILETIPVPGVGNGCPSHDDYLVKSDEIFIGKQSWDHTFHRPQVEVDHEK
jgi:hypothetical protein